MSRSTMHLGSTLFALAMLTACDPTRATRGGERAVAEEDAPAKRPEPQAETRSSAPPGPTTKPTMGLDPRPAPSVQVASRPAAPGEVGPAELRFVESKVQVDERSGDPKEDAFRYFRLWGEFTNASSSVVEDLAADIRYFDAAGKELGIDSILTGVKQDVGDKSPGETIRGSVSFVAPGATVPVTHIRSLNKLGGKYASYTITFRPAAIAKEYPVGKLEGATDQVANVANENLPNASPNEHRVIGGSIRNDGKADCRSPGLVVGFYDASGKLADVREGDAKATLVEPGKSAAVRTFTLVGFDDAWKSTAKVKAWVRCSVY